MGRGKVGDVTIVEFLTARLDEDEAEARRTVQYGYDSDGPNGVLAAAGRLGREVEAKRRIVALHHLTVSKVETAPYDPWTRESVPDEFEVDCEVCGWASSDQSSACVTLHLLALPYADHSDYREEWRP